MRLLIDARKAFDSGIGTYIRCLMPRVTSRLSQVEFSLLVERGGAQRHQYMNLDRVHFVEISSRPLSIDEQVELRLILKGYDLFWATSLAHPIFGSTPLIATVHDVAQLALPRNTIGDVLVKQAARVYFRSIRAKSRLLLFNSEFTRNEFAKWVGKPISNSSITPLGVGPEWFLEAPADPTTAPYAVCIGNLRPHKNVIFLLEAFAAVVDSLPFDLVLVGHAEGFASDDARYRSLKERLGKRLRFTGFLPEPELQRCVAQAAALIQPSLYEGFGLPALEGMSAGTPVIAACAAALPEVCGDRAAYFDPSSVQSLSQQLLLLAAQTAERRLEVVTNGIARAREFTWDRTARLTAEAITQTLANFHGSAD